MIFSFSETFKCYLPMWRDITMILMIWTLQLNSDNTRKPVNEQSKRLYIQPGLMNFKRGEMWQYLSKLWCLMIVMYSAVHHVIQYWPIRGRHCPSIREGPDGFVYVRDSHEIWRSSNRPSCWSFHTQNHNSDTSLMTSQHWLRQWLGAVRQQAISWAHVDQVLCRHVA